MRVWSMRTSKYDFLTFNAHADHSRDLIDVIATMLSAVPVPKPAADAT